MLLKLAEHLATALQDGVGALRDSPNPSDSASRDAWRDRLTPLLHRALQECQLVTREEFDTQAAVLARSRAQLDALRLQIDALEARLNAR
jgi:ubiquinone biosynthesis accessory factor UbiK